MGLRRRSQTPDCDRAPDRERGTPGRPAPYPVGSAQRIGSAYGTLPPPGPERSEFRLDPTPTHPAHVQTHLVRAALASPDRGPARLGDWAARPRSGRSAPAGGRRPTEVASALRRVVAEVVLLTRR